MRQLGFGPGSVWRTVTVGLAIFGTLFAVAFVLFPQHFHRSVLGLVLMQPFMILAFVVMGFRSRIALGGRFPLRQLIEANGIALALSAFLPAKSGELAKPWVLWHTAKIPRSTGFSMVVIERTFDALIVLLLVGLAASTTIGSAVILPTGILLWGLTAVVLGLAIVVWLSGKVRQFLRDVIRTTIQTVSNPRNFVGMVFSSVILWGLSLAAMIVFGLSSGHEELSVQALLTVFVATTVGLAAGITPGGWGIVEGVTVLLLLLYGLTVGDALAFAVTYRMGALSVPIALSLRPLKTIIGQRAADRDG